MKMEVEIISKEKIKPSSPTPSHLRTFKLSLLDQLIPAPYAPVILFYPHPTVLMKSCSSTLSTSTSSDHDHDHHDNADHLHHQVEDVVDHDDVDATTIMNRVHLLKTSLAEALTAFYPLAGEIKDDGLSIDCNDQGAHFLEARVKYSTLDEFLSRPDLLLLHRFLPCDPMNPGGGGLTSTVTNIQVSAFECGGIAIGLCISHKILDGAALCTFLKAWTAIARLRSQTPSRLLLRSSSSSSSSSWSWSSSSSQDSILLVSLSDSDDHHQAGPDTAGAANSIICPNLSAATFLFPTATNDELWLRDSSIPM